MFIPGLLIFSTILFASVILQLAQVRTGFAGTSGSIKGDTIYSGGGQHVCAGGSCADTEKVVIIFDFFQP